MQNPRYGHKSPNPSLERDPSYERERREYRDFSNDQGTNRYGDGRNQGQKQTQHQTHGDNSWQDDRNWGRDERSWLQDDRGWQRENHNHGFMDSVKSFFGVGPKGYKRSDDRIKEEVCEALARDPQVNASDIEVDVLESVVTLTGTVDNRMMKRQAEVCVESISGVEDIHNSIRVSFTGKLSSGIDADTSANMSAKPKTTTTRTDLNDFKA